MAFDETAAGPSPPDPASSEDARPEHPDEQLAAILAVLEELSTHQHRQAATLASVIEILASYAKAIGDTHQQLNQTRARVAASERSSAPVAGSSTSRELADRAHELAERTVQLTQESERILAIVRQRRSVWRDAETEHER
jgi:hypothetical protein